MIHYGTYRGAVVGLRGAVVGVRGAAVGVRDAAVALSAISAYLHTSYLGAQLSASPKIIISLLGVITVHNNRDNTIHHSSRK